MGGQPSRSAEFTQRICDAVEGGHAHTLKLLLKFIQHVPPVGHPSVAGGSSGSSLFNADLKLSRPIPTPIDTLDEAEAAFHARAATLAQQQALEAKLNSASFPVQVDLNALRACNSASGDPILIHAVKKDEASMIQLLAASGIDLDLCDSKGYTAFHHAVLLHRLGCIQILLDAGVFTLVHTREFGMLPSQITTHGDLEARLNQAEREDEIKLLKHIFRIGDSESTPAYSLNELASHALFAQSTSADFPLALYAIACPREFLIYTSSPSPNFDIEVYFRAPAIRHASDCICMYYVDDPTEPQKMRSRVGSVVYLAPRRKPSSIMIVPPEINASLQDATMQSSNAFASLRTLGWDRITVTFSVGSIAPGTYRFGYFDSQRQQILAVSDVFTIRETSAPRPIGAVRSANSSPSASSSSHSAGPPSSSTGAGGGVFSFLPSLWSPAPSTSHPTDAPSTPVPVALHPSFQVLSSPSFASYYDPAHPPPAYFRSHFTLNSHAVQLALQLDPNLQSFKDRMQHLSHSGTAPMKDLEFWTRYFWSMSKLSDEELTTYPTPNTSAASSSTPSTSNIAAALTTPKPSVTPITTTTISATTTTTTSTYQTPVASPVDKAVAAPPPVSSYVPPSLSMTNSNPTQSIRTDTNTPTTAAPASIASQTASTPISSKPIAPISTSTSTSSTLFSSSTAKSAARSPVTNRRGDSDDEEADSSYVPPSFAKLPIDKVDP